MSLVDGIYQVRISNLGKKNLIPERTILFLKMVMWFKQAQLLKFSLLEGV